MAQKRKTSARTSSARGGKNQSKPIRREVGGVICIVLAVCAAASYFQKEGVLVDYFAKLLRGLFGAGYFFAVPALGIAAYRLIWHKGKPVAWGTASSLLLILFGGSLMHLAAGKAPEGDALLRGLWLGGIDLKCGGVLSGLFGNLLQWAFGKTVGIIIVGILTLVCVFVALKLTPSALWSAVKDHEYLPYEEEEEAEEPAQRTIRVQSAPRVKPQIDIPLDDEPVRPKRSRSRAAASAAEPEKGGELFKPKSADIKTPDELLREEGKTEEKPLSKAEVEKEQEQVSREIEKNAQKMDDEYDYPPITLLNENLGGNAQEAGAEVRRTATSLEETLSSFGVEVTPGEVVRGSSVTRYEFKLEQGIKLSKVTNLQDDIALALGASGVRVAAIPNKNSVFGIEVPNRNVDMVTIRDVLESNEFCLHKSKVAFALGKDIGGHNVVGDIAKLPHVLIAGTTGSGKSVCANSLIVSLLYKSSPQEVRFIMVDPKMVELAPYNGIPHLLIPVVTDPKKAAGALQWAVYEMMKRYTTFSEHRVKNLEGYNALAETQEDLEKMPSVVVVIDELADLMLVAAKEVEDSICRIAQMGRAAGIHLVIATQRPSADVITGLMKANIPSRIAFAVASSLESRIILDNPGAEKLIGHGDMLYAPLGDGKPKRVQGCFISAEEIDKVVSYVKENGETEYDESVLEHIDKAIAEKAKGKGAPTAATETDEDSTDELLPAAIEIVFETGQASVSMLQRRLKLGYSRAGRLMDQMEACGIVGPFEGSKPRQLLMTQEEWQERQMGGMELPLGEENEE